MLVAESLRRLPEPVTALLAPPAVAAPARVTGEIARALLPPLAEETPPPWLRPGQVEAFRRAVAAIRLHGGALLAEPVGTGKSWIAMAVAAAADPRPPVVLAPAALKPQWRQVLEAAGVPGTLVSHESVSRARLPEGDHGLVVVDESHWFRNPLTHRYRTLAPWLVGKRGLLVTATPVVNSAADLGHQLRLFLRDDALTAAGLASLRGVREDRAGTHALAEVVVTGWADAASRPSLQRTSVRPRCDRGLAALLQRLDQLRLSPDPAIAALLRIALWGAAASSPAAFEASLRRYLVLLDHAADARAAGRTVGREALRRFILADPGQLVLWQLLPDAPGGGTPLVPEDRAAVRLLREGAAALAGRTDGKSGLLRQLLADGRPTVVFTGAVATVGYLRRVLGPDPVAWCSGAAAGIGGARLPREAVLSWFGPRRGLATPEGLRVPAVLVTTDVAAEGLDLQGAERVVHYDLPWTAIRTDQRAGRVRRLHSAHREVLEHWILPPRRIARRLGVEGLIARKRALPGALGLGESAEAPWRRRIEVARRLGAAPGSPGVGSVVLEAAAAADALACVAIEFEGRPALGRLFVHHPRRGWRGDEPQALDLLARVAEARPAPPPAPTEVDALLESLAAPVREALRRATGAAWEPGWRTHGNLLILRRLRHWARIAARARDARLLQRLDAAVRGLGRGLTAGEETIVARLAAREDSSLLEHLRVLPAPGPELALPGVRLVGLLMLCEAGKG